MTVVVLCQLDGLLPVGVRWIDLLSDHFPVCVAVSGGHVDEGTQFFHFFGQQDYFPRATGVQEDGILKGVVETDRSSCVEDYTYIFYQCVGVSFTYALKQLQLNSDGWKISASFT